MLKTKLEFENLLWRPLTGGTIFIYSEFTRGHYLVSSSSLMVRNSKVNIVVPAHACVAICRQ